MASAPKKGKVDKELIRELAGLLDEASLSEIEIEQAGLRVRVSRSGGVPMQAVHQTVPAASPATATATNTSAADQMPSGAVPSPMVGTTYLAAAPGADPFVKVGDTVSQGQTLLIVEAMKTMNQIPAPTAGKVARILVENGQPVEYGEPLVILE